MRGDATSFAPSSICDEQWREVERPLLLPCAQEESTKQRFLVMASVFDNERVAVPWVASASQVEGTQQTLSFAVFMCFVQSCSRERERRHLSQARSC